MASTPVFTSTPIIGTARLTAANTARDGSGTIVPLLTGATNGTRVDRITFISAQATAAAQAAMVGRVFISDTGNTIFRLYIELLLPTITPSNTVIGQRQQAVFLGGLNLQSGMVLYCTKSVHGGVADQFDVIAEGGHF